MTLAVWFLTGWLIGTGLGVAFIMVARGPSPEPFMALDELADLARVA